ncbi:hypothetical protein PQI07_25940 [Methylobacterium sp. 092160098-2]|uniref:hypothetical protein n=1 Tax=Methylobacterium sp. 092160098-2 TaxID=3025129 RepID=UPI002381BFB2|nr:hypothetical protein [Methylobacterium sp. 092160098-2]MDE4914116.1 hypothetical protein [Methylobacterium sp. 092160098-2]
MKLDFSRLLSPEQQARLERKAATLARMHALPDRWLGRELAQLARRLRGSVPELASPVLDTDGYTKHLLWDVVPELARRLGEPLEHNESKDIWLRTAEGEELRRDVANCLLNTSAIWLMRIVPEERQDDLAVLMNEAANGSPVALALDRLVPPGHDSTDRLAASLREVSRARGHEAMPAWHPGLQLDPPVLEAASPRI